MNNEFKIFFKKALLFLLVLILFDLIIGHFAKEVFYSQKTGKYARVTNSIYNDNSEVLIMGSSHASHHYIPEILENELGMVSYNAGVQGQYLIFHEALLKMILKNHSPKLIILNIDDWWMNDSKEAYERLAALYPYYWDYRDEIEPILSLNSRFLNIRLLSKAYQTNSTIVHAIKYFLLPQKDYKGYIPLFNKMKEPEDNNEKSQEDNQAAELNPGIDRNFVYLFEDFINSVKNKNLDLIFVISPRAFSIDHNELNKDSFSIMKSLADEYKIPFIDFTNHESFIGQYQLFNDPGHLNNDGARLFSKMVGQQLKELLY